MESQDVLKGKHFSIESGPRVAKSIDSRGGDIQPPSKEKLGATQIQMKSGWLFTTGNGKQAATLGKQLCVELLQVRHPFSKA